MKKQCAGSPPSVSARDPNRFSVTVECTMAATIERAGAWYCNGHDPVERAKRKATREAREDAVHAFEATGDYPPDLDNTLHVAHRELHLLVTHHHNLAGLELMRVARALGAVEHALKLHRETP